MRWKALFDDLEAQADALAAAELEAEVRDRVRREHSLLRLVDRLSPAVGAALQLLLAGAGRVDGVLLDTGVDWLLLQEAPSRDLLVPTAAVLSVAGLGRRSGVPGEEGAVGKRLDLRWALRGLARDRAAVRVVLVDGTTVAGTIDRVGADHLELAEHAAGEPRRAGAVTGIRLLPLPALALVRSG
jgi:hypothetical protein